MLVAPDLALNPVSTMSSSGQERQGAELKRTTTEGKISGADMRLLASQKHTVLGAKAQQQLVYRKAERDLLLVSSATPLSIAVSPQVSLSSALSPASTIHSLELTHYFFSHF